MTDETLPTVAVRMTIGRNNDRADTSGAVRCAVPAEQATA